MERRKLEEINHAIKCVRVCEQLKCGEHYLRHVIDEDKFVYLVFMCNDSNEMVGIRCTKESLAKFKETESIK